MLISLLFILAWGITDAAGGESLRVRHNGILLTRAASIQDERRFKCPTCYRLGRPIPEQFQEPDCSALNSSD